MAASLAIPHNERLTGQPPAHSAQPVARQLGAPALLIAVCFAGGDLLTHLCWLQPGIVLIAAVLLVWLSLVAAWFAPRIAVVPATLLCVLLGIFCTEAEPRLPSHTPLERIAWATPAPNPTSRRLGLAPSHSVEGSVVRVTRPRLLETYAPYSEVLRRERSQQVDLRVAFVDGRPLPAPEGLRLTLYAPESGQFPMLTCGQHLQGTVEMHAQERFLDPGVWDAGTWLRQQGISALGSARADDVTVSATNERTGIHCRMHSLQRVAGERLKELSDWAAPGWQPQVLRLSPEDAAMLTAMLTSDRTLLGHRLRAGFERTGSFHLLVVSGMHLAIFSGLIFWVARRAQLPRPWASLATIALSLGYALFTGFGQPVQRAFWMVSLYLGARLLWRERSRLNAIGVAALVMLMVNADALLDAGFQMTLLSVFAVAGIAVPVAERTFGPYLRATRGLWLLPVDPSLTPGVAQFRVSLRMMAAALRPFTGAYGARVVFPRCVWSVLVILELVITSLAIETFMVLPMAIDFHRITVVALPVNLLVVPLLGVLLPLALLLLVLVALAPKLAVVPAMAVALLLHVVRAVVHLFGATRLGDFRIPTPQPLMIALALLFLLAALVLIRSRRYGINAACAALAIATLLVVFPGPVQHRAGVLEISTIDVGQGDSLLVITPRGKTLLIDGGGLVGAGGPSGANPNQQNSNFDVGNDVVSPVLWARGIRRLDAVAITHAHADHIGGMPAVLAAFRPRELWIGINPHSASYDALLAETKITGTQIVHHVAGDAFTIDDVRVRVLAPEAGYQPAATPGNNDSVVLQMRYGDTTALLEGDAESSSEDRMLARGGLHADFLKVGHHGSRTSTTPEFLAAVAPAWAAISVGHRNFYGHPRLEVLRELQDAQVRTYRTDMLGLSTWYLDGRHVNAAVWADEP